MARTLGFSATSRRNTAQSLVAEGQRFLRQFEKEDLRDDFSKKLDEERVKAYRNAEIQFRRALRKDRKFPAAHLGLGKALFLQKRHEEAVPALETAAQLKPYDLHVKLLLGHALILSGQQERAVPHLKEAARKYLRARLLLRGMGEEVPPHKGEE